MGERPVAGLRPLGRVTDELLVVRVGGRASRPVERTGTGGQVEDRAVMGGTRVVRTRRVARLDREL